MSWGSRSDRRRRCRRAARQKTNAQLYSAELQPWRTCTPRLLFFRSNLAASVCRRFSFDASRVEAHVQSSDGVVKKKEKESRGLPTLLAVHNGCFFEAGIMDFLFLFGLLRVEECLKIDWKKVGGKRSACK